MHELIPALRNVTLWHPKLSQLMSKPQGGGIKKPKSHRTEKIPRVASGV